MDDRDLVDRISELDGEESRLERSHAGEGLGVDERQRLRGIEVALDRFWDLLRRRRAGRAAVTDPDDVRFGPESTVEGYQQ